MALGHISSECCSLSCGISKCILPSDDDNYTRLLKLTNVSCIDPATIYDYDLGSSMDSTAGMPMASFIPQRIALQVLFQLGKYEAKKKVLSYAATATTAQTATSGFYSTACRLKWTQKEMYSEALRKYRCISCVKHMCAGFNRGLRITDGVSCPGVS